MPPDSKYIQEREKEDAGTHCRHPFVVCGSARLDRIYHIDRFGINDLMGREAWLPLFVEGGNRWKFKKTLKAAVTHRG